MVPPCRVVSRGGAHEWSSRLTSGVPVGTVLLYGNVTKRRASGRSRVVAVATAGAAPSRVEGDRRAPLA
ncbi:MAG: hypothetical protein AVDCRST_MAG40-2091 [uncultured Gemmatimonadaceae bacterium]|uniref:Uncharacterized protein n=1 Tax=uncultured Gemmatimonadaceae bacterium TaxID=246130 RepID=A0A6J4LIX4_9BACT|nr:MAG: hypothetical protein AVDCRST_MAG40-2091 [uncultured Gemmatimonadaceae bacterium]